MRSFIRLIIISGLLLTLIGCSMLDNINTDHSNTTGDKPGMVGYVVDRENSRILVVDPVPQDFSSTGGLSEFYHAIWFSNVSEEIEIGEQVKVWFDMVAESYPGQSEAIKISIIEGEKPEKADLTEAEAIRRALTSEWKTRGISVIKSATFDPETDVWEVLIKQDDDEYQLQVVDSPTEGSNH
jgi:hypothetical protein